MLFILRARLTGSNSNYHGRKPVVVYFEHNEDAVKSAQSIGIKTYYYDAEKKDLDALKSYLLENL